MIFLFTIIILALVFDYINGFHDAAISIATIVSTKVLTPFQAVLWAAIFNFAAFFIFRYFIGEFKIGNTIAHFVDREFITLPVIFSGLIAAISWNLLTWWLGIPSSSSHTLIGGFVGAALAHAGGWLVHGKNVIDYATVIPTFCFIVLAPLIGFIVALVITILIVNIFRRSHPYKAEGMVPAAAAVVLRAAEPGTRRERCAEGAGYHRCRAGRAWRSGPGAGCSGLGADIAASPAIALGTMSGGWRIVKTMGSRITKVTPLEGVCAETAGAITLFLTQYLGIPVSTTHTITGAIVGVGATKRMSAVRWGVTINLVWAWVLTIPVSAGLAAIVYWLYHALTMI